MEALDIFVDTYNKNAIKAHFHRTFQSCGVDFYALVIEAHQLTLQDSTMLPAHHKGRNWWAECLYGRMVGLAQDYYGDLVFKDQHKRPYMKIGADIRIYFKKLDAKNKPANIITRHVEDLLSQNISDGTTKIYLGYVGYKLNNNDYTNLNGIYASYVHEFIRNKIEWVLDMEEYTKSIVRISKNEQVVQDEQMLIFTKKQNNEQEGNL